MSLSSRKLVVDPKYPVNGFICLHQHPPSTAAGWSRPLLLPLGKDIISHGSDKI